jgi:hypothetical protein
VDGWSRASSTAAATNTSALFGIYSWGWGFSTSQDFNDAWELLRHSRTPRLMPRPSRYATCPVETGAAPATDNGDHAPLYHTLREWKQNADDPTAWRRERLQGILASHPLR